MAGFSVVSPLRVESSFHCGLHFYTGFEYKIPGIFSKDKPLNFIQTPFTKATVNDKVYEIEKNVQHKNSKDFWKNTS